MKKYLFVFLGVLIPFHPFVAENVDVESARKVASTFIQTKNPLRSANAAELTLAYTAQKESDLRSTEVTYYYVFNVANDNSFVIVSGDDVAKPILGYSTSGKYDATNLAPGFVYWMNTLQQEIDRAITVDSTPTEEIRQAWNAYLNGETAQLRNTTAEIVAPLITTKWGQREPYNLFTPNNYPTGCVATAMAQIMNYYEYPEKGQGTIPAYQTEALKIDIPAIKLDTVAPYAWDKMQDQYSGVTDEDARNAVATLVYHCGVSVKMDYMESGSGAINIAMRPALVTFFGYDKSMQTKNRLYYEQEWDNMLRNELDQGRPVFYAGTNASGGAHAFICDGYDDEGCFHFNWGWDGSSDGYYATSATAAGTITYNQNQLIITNIFPNAGGEETVELKLKEGTTINFNPSVTSETKNVAQGETFIIEATYHNAGATDFIGSYGVVLINENDEIIEAIGSADFANNHEQYYYFIETLPASSYYLSPFTMTCAISDQVSPGNYRIKAAVKPQKDGEWIVVNGQPGYTDYLEIALTDQVISSGTDLALYNQGSYAGAFNVNKLYPGEPGTFYFSVVNRGDQPFFGSLELYIYSEHGELKQIIEKNNVLIDKPNSNYPFLYLTSEITVPDGKYLLTLYAKPVTGNIFLMPSYDESAYQNKMKIIVGDYVGINEPNLSQQGEIIIYPNPVNDRLFIHNYDTKIYSVKIADISGKTMKQLFFDDSGEISIPVDELQSGNYLVLIQTDNGIVVKKIIKN